MHLDLEAILNLLRVQVGQDQLGCNLGSIHLQQHCALTQTEVAKELGIVVRAYQRYEHGDRTPPMETLIALADLYVLAKKYHLPHSHLSIRTMVEAGRLEPLGDSVFRFTA